MELPSAHFKPNLEKKRNYSKKRSYISLYFGKWNFLALILKNFLYFLKRNLFLYFGKRKLRKIPYISGNGNPEKFLIFQQVT